MISRELPSQTKTEKDKR